MCAAGLPMTIRRPVLLRATAGRAPWSPLLAPAHPFRPSTRRRLPPAPSTRAADPSTAAVMSVAIEMSGIVREASQPCAPGESVKALIRRAAIRLGLPHRRARALWYAEARAIRAEEADRLRAAQAALLADRARRLQAELALLHSRLAALEDADAGDAAAVLGMAGARGAGRSRGAAR
jgi:hypothetical protein